MIKVKFYLDKADKNERSPIHLVIRQKDIHIKAATGEKVLISDWDAKNQTVKISDYSHVATNKFLSFLRNEVEKYLNTSNHLQITDKKIKSLVKTLVEKKKENTDVRILNEEPAEYQKMEKITLVDLFAGAGGFSEGFLQAENGNKYFDFLLASDINENCELTHLARYNYQLGLATEFLRQDITEPDFIDNLKGKLKGAKVDVVCGGPPCQSFSLAGRRKKFDKKDDLFAHYLEVIKILRPKYFVMENVKGILTKEGGKVKEMILKEIKSILDLTEFHRLHSFLLKLKKVELSQIFILECYSSRLQFENSTEKNLEKLKENYVSVLENKFRLLTPKIVDYKTSKTDRNISTIRHGFNLLKRSKELAFIRKKVILEKAHSDLDNDFFADKFDSFLTTIEFSSILDQIQEAFMGLNPSNVFKNEIDDIIKGLEIFNFSFDECIDGLTEMVSKAKLQKEFDQILKQIRLYNIDQPFVALASDYGVPQNRERVLFIGCRKDQKLIKSIPPTVNQKEKVTVFEALHDLDFVGNNDEQFNYVSINLKERFNGSTDKMLSLIKKRGISGDLDNSCGLTFAEWSRRGRLTNRFTTIKNPFYVRNEEELQNPMTHLVAPLHNHKTSKQSDDVIRRLNVIRECGDYNKAKVELQKIGLGSDKRNYNVLKPDSQSPTVLTIADDYIHYASPRALTVREMARLQSFDDSFVFQGKRSTGGNKRKFEVPQFTLVGNAVPPLMARAVAMEILKNIK
jgi:DNA (cytosine-5)-methyltransferase 1